MSKPRPKACKEAGKLQALQRQLAEADETIEAIRSGAVDALVVHGPQGEQVFTLKGAEKVYRVLVEAMNEGAVSLGRDGGILYCNARFSQLVNTPLEKVLGTPFSRFVVPAERAKLDVFLKKCQRSRDTMETVLVADGAGAILEQTGEITVLLSSSPFPGDTEILSSMVITDITERKRMELAQRYLAEKVLVAQEQERHRVSRELHDGISQLLYSARHRLHEVEKTANELNRPKLREDVSATRQLLEKTMGEVRLISRNLRPSELDDLGLSPAIQSLVEDFEVRTKIPVHCECDLHGHLKQDTELAIYRIVQEALTNVGKHAQASRVVIQLGRQRGNVHLRIRDNGRGFSRPGSVAKGQGLGLINMQERAAFVGGSLSIRSIPRQGTEIALQLPR
jgi:PAS domain S-box-containing protein